MVGISGEVFALNRPEAIEVRIRWGFVHSP